MSDLMLIMSDCSFSCFCFSVNPLKLCRVGIFPFIGLITLPFFLLFCEHSISISWSLPPSSSSLSSKEVTAWCRKAVKSILCSVLISLLPLLLSLEILPFNFVIIPLSWSVLMQSSISIEWALWRLDTPFLEIDLFDNWDSKKKLSSELELSTLRKFLSFLLKVELDLAFLDFFLPSSSD